MKSEDNSEVDAPAPYFTKRQLKKFRTRKGRRLAYLASLPGERRMKIFEGERKRAAAVPPWSLKTIAAGIKQKAKILKRKKAKEQAKYAEYRLRRNNRRVRRARRVYEAAQYA